MGIGGTVTGCRTSLEGKNGAVRRRRGAGLRRHLIVRGQLEGGKKSCNKAGNINSDMESVVQVYHDKDEHHFSKTHTKEQETSLHSLI